METQSDEPIGTVHTPSGDLDIIGVFELNEGGRKVAICKVEDGSYLMRTTRKIENGEPVVSDYWVSRETMVLMGATIYLGFEYFGIKVSEELESLFSKIGSEATTYGVAGFGDWKPITEGD